MKTPILVGFSLASSAALLAPSFGVNAQSYPDRPVRMLVGFAPGGGTDIFARVIAQKISETWGQQMVVENRPGATGTIVSGIVAKARPDGYILMMGTVATQAILPEIMSKLPYDPEKDFVPVTLAASVPHFVLVHPSLPVMSVKALIALAKANPGKLTFPSAGNGSTPHLAGEMFKTMAGVDLVHVPYKGSGQSMQDVLAGQHPVTFDTVAAVAHFVREGRLRALAVTSAKRVPEFPALPTVAEAGVPGYEMTSWYGVFAPAETPAPIISKLHADINRVLQMPDVRERLNGMGVDPILTRSPAAFAAMVHADIVRYAKVVKAANLRID
ncbi:MAG: tripartite tricarboxylate transporter substrate binding protein [Betaproteobacteria bacterium]